MRILLPIHQYPHSRAGTEVYTHSLARELAQRHDVLVYCHEPTLDGGDEPAREAPYEGITVRRVAAFGRGAARGPWAEFRRDYANPYIAADFGRTVDRYRPVVVHVQHLKGLSAGLVTQCAQRGIPVVMTLHDYWAVCPNAQCVRPDGTICYGRARLACATCRRGRACRCAGPLTSPLFSFSMPPSPRAARRAALYLPHFLKGRMVTAGVRRVHRRAGMVGWARLALSCATAGVAGALCLRKLMAGKWRSWCAPWRRRPTQRSAHLGIGRPPYARRLRALAASAQHHPRGGR